MTAYRQAANLSRALGLLFATGAASVLAWSQIGNDMQQFRQTSQNISYIKQSYRKEAVILTCWERPGFFSSDHPLALSRRVIPPPQYRDRLFSLSELDGMVENQQCQISNNPQDLEIALHEGLHLERPTTDPHSRRFLARVP